VTSITLQVDLAERSYPIIIGAGFLKDEALLQQYIGSGQLMVVTNETIAPLYLDSLLTKIPNADTIILPDGEQFKQLATVERVFEALLNQRHNRTTTLLALGGGVVGDMTGFAAACYQRGVKFIQMPTTLLAQVDSSVGGKTGVNHALGKNMIGAFHQPTAVLIDTDTLSSLPIREYQAGLAEVIKYGLICDADFFIWLEQNMPALIVRDQAALQYAIARSCENKAKVVAADEREGGFRAILNLGHTFGHAIETATEYKAWLHGEAVGFGMIMALDLSTRLGLINASVLERTIALIGAAGLPVSAPANLPTSDAILGLMGMDKKVLDGHLRLVLLRAIGDAFVSNDFDADLLKQTLQHYL
tara:strand:- start:21675 stop:22754 length:1080 start_codon:yes stop_codon:yes gene_type:complete